MAKWQKTADKNKDFKEMFIGAFTSKGIYIIMSV